MSFRSGLVAFCVLAMAPSSFAHEHFGSTSSAASFVFGSPLLVGVSFTGEFALPWVLGDNLSLLAEVAGEVGDESRSDTLYGVRYSSPLKFGSVRPQSCWVQVMYGTQTSPEESGVKTWSIGVGGDWKLGLGDQVALALRMQLEYLRRPDATDRSSFRFTIGPAVRFTH